MKLPVKVGNRVSFGDAGILSGVVRAITLVDDEVMAVVLLENQCQGFMEGRDSYIRLMVASVDGLAVCL